MGYVVIELDNAKDITALGAEMNRASREQGKALPNEIIVPLKTVSLIKSLIS